METSPPTIVQRNFNTVPVFDDGDNSLKEITLMHWNVLADKLAFGSFDKVPE